MAAMCFSTPEIVMQLLDAGANSQDVDRYGHDPMILACTFGRLDNVKVWCSRFENWDVNRRAGSFVGSTALHTTVYFGRDKLDLLRYLIEVKNADITVLNSSGSSALLLACANEDADSKVVRYLLQRGVDVNHQINSQTSRWRMMRAVARLVVRFKLSKLKLIHRLAQSGGLTAIHYAARRGDVEIVELLIKHRANLLLRNDLGRDVFSYCDAFPEMIDAVRRVCVNRFSFSPTK